MSFNKYLNSGGEQNSSPIYFEKETDEYSGYSSIVGKDLQAYIESGGERTDFDADAIRLAKTLVAKDHVSEDTDEYYDRLRNDDYAYDPRDEGLEKKEYEYEGPINPNVNIEADAAFVQDDIIDKMIADLNEQFPPNGGTAPPIQFQSTNATATNMTKLLFNLGVKRWYLPLLLYDIGLDGIDPRDENLSIEMQERIRNECIRNVFYYCREVVRIPAPGNLHGVKLRFHIGSFTSIFLTANDITYYLEQPRQTYKSGTDNTLVGWVFNLAATNSQIGLYANNNIKAKDNLMNVIDILELLPAYLQTYRFKASESKSGLVIEECKDYAKQMEVNNKLLNNKIISGTTGQTKENAMKVARGKSLIKIGFDEIGFSKFNWFAYGAAQPSHEEAAANAEKHGIPHNITMTSTPPDATTKEGEWLFKLLFEECVRFSLKMFDLSKDELKEYMLNNGKKDIVFCSFAYNELGFTQEWLIDRLRKLDRTVFDVEVMLKWKRDLAKSPFSRRALELIEIYAKNSRYTEYIMDKKHIFKLYDGFEENRIKKIVIGIDVASGRGNNSDYSTMVGVDPITTKVLFTYRTNESDTEIFAGVIIKFAREFLHQPIFIIERNGIGAGVVDKIKHTPDLVDSLYYTGQGKSSIYSLSEHTKKTNAQYGFVMSHESREIMTKTILTTRVNRFKSYFNSEDIVRELMSLTILNGRIDHLPGYHDDLIMSYLMVLYVLEYDDDMDVKFGLHKPTPVDDSAVIMSQLDVFNKVNDMSENWTPEQKHREFLKRNAMEDGRIRGFKTLEDATYKADVSNANFISDNMKKLSSSDYDNTNDEEVIVEDIGISSYFGNGQRINSLKRKVKSPF